MASWSFRSSMTFPSSIGWKWRAPIAIPIITRSGRPTRGRRGVTWAPFDGLTIRGVRSRSVRVPNFGELYSPVSTGITGSIGDPCLLRNYLSAKRAPPIAAPRALPPRWTPIRTTSSSRAAAIWNLKPETSNSFTVGVVVQPRFIRGFDATDRLLEHKDRKCRHIVQHQPDDGAMRRSSYHRQCLLSLRPARPRWQGHLHLHPAGERLAPESAWHRFRPQLSFPARKRPARLRFKGSYLLEREIQTIPGIEAGNIKYAGGYADPRFRGYLLASYDTDHF